MWFQRPDVFNDLYYHLKAQALYHCIQKYNSALGQPSGHRNCMKIKLAEIVVLIWNNMWEFIYKSALSDIVALIFFNAAETVIQTPVFVFNVLFSLYSRLYTYDVYMGINT